MNDKTDGSAPTKSSVSVPFLLIAGLFAVAIIAGPWIMFQVMVKQEQGIIAAPNAIPEKAADTPQLQSAVETNSSSGDRAQGGGGARGDGRQFDPEAFFATRDEDSNGKLEGEEISERMQGRLEQIDTDKDGAVSKEEFLAGMQNRGGAGGRGDGQQGRRNRPEFDDSEESNDENDETTEKKDL